MLRPKKNNIMFLLTRLTLFYCPDSTDFICNLVDTELKGRYKTVISLSGESLGLRNCYSLNKFDEALWKGEKNEHFNQCFHEITNEIK